MTPVYRLGSAIAFPDPRDADPSGLLAVGGDLSCERLLLAYSLGIFPWYSEGQPILWHSPDPRTVLLPQHLHVSRSLRKALRRRRFEVRLDTAFDAVIGACARVPRRGQDGTWITAAMRRAYVALHREGFAHSAEAYEAGRLVGGVYGVSLGGAFFGESMFTRVSGASKFALAMLVERLRVRGYQLLDVQWSTPHLRMLGAVEIPRREYLRRLRAALELPARFTP